jgi:hypothetical protein
MAGGPWGICDRCGFKVRHSRLRKEWTGLMVCPDDWDPKPAELRPPPVKPEGLPIRNPRPEPTPTFREEGELGGDDL